MEMLELNWNPTDKLKNKNALFGPNLQPPTRQQERTFARVGTEKVFALRAQGGGRVGYLEPKLHRVVQISQNLEHATLSSNSLDLTYNPPLNSKNALLRA